MPAANVELRISRAFPHQSLLNQLVPSASGGPRKEAMSRISFDRLTRSLVLKSHALLTLSAAHARQLAADADARFAAVSDPSQRKALLLLYVLLASHATLSATMGQAAQRLALTFLRSSYREEIDAGAEALAVGYDTGLRATPDMLCGIVSELRVCEACDVPAVLRLAGGALCSIGRSAASATELSDVARCRSALLASLRPLAEAEARAAGEGAGGLHFAAALAAMSAGLMDAGDADAPSALARRLHREAVQCLEALVAAASAAAEAAAAGGDSGAACAISAAELALRCLARVDRSASIPRELCDALCEGSLLRLLRGAAGGAAGGAAALGGLLTRIADAATPTGALAAQALLLLRACLPALKGDGPPEGAAPAEALLHLCAAALRTARPLADAPSSASAPHSLPTPPPQKRRRVEASASGARVQARGRGREQAASRKEREAAAADLPWLVGEAFRKDGKAYVAVAVSEGGAELALLCAEAPGPAGAAGALLAPPPAGDCLALSVQEVRTLAAGATRRSPLPCSPARSDAAGGEPAAPAASLLDAAAFPGVRALLLRRLAAGLRSAAARQAPAATAALMRAAAHLAHCGAAAVAAAAADLRADLPAESFALMGFAAAAAAAAAGGARPPAPLLDAAAELLPQALDRGARPFEALRCFVAALPAGEAPRAAVSAAFGCASGAAAQRCAAAAAAAARWDLALLALCPAAPPDSRGGGQWQWEGAAPLCAAALRCFGAAEVLWAAAGGLPAAATVDDALASLADAVQELVAEGLERAGVAFGAEEAEEGAASLACHGAQAVLRCALLLAEGASRGAEERESLRLLRCLVRLRLRCLDALVSARALLCPEASLLRCAAPLDATLDAHAAANCRYVKAALSAAGVGYRRAALRCRGAGPACLASVSALRECAAGAERVAGLLQARLAASGGAEGGSVSAEELWAMAPAPPAIFRPAAVASWRLGSVHPSAVREASVEQALVMRRRSGREPRGDSPGACAAQHPVWAATLRPVAAPWLAVTGDVENAPAGASHARLIVRLAGVARRQRPGKGRGRAKGAAGAPWSRTVTVRLRRSLDREPEGLGAAALRVDEAEEPGHALQQLLDESSGDPHFGVARGVAPPKGELHFLAAVPCPGPEDLAAARGEPTLHLALQLLVDGRWRQVWNDASVRLLSR